MRDYNYIRENGERVTVAQMRTEEIGAIIAIGGVEIVDDDGGTGTEAQVMERLRIELIIRSLS